MEYAPQRHFFPLVRAHSHVQRGNEEEGIQPKLMLTDVMMISKIKYIHHNPLKRGYVDEASHWRYSSARDYEGIDGLLDVERFW